MLNIVISIDNATGMSVFLIALNINGFLKGQQLCKKKKEIIFWQRNPFDYIPVQSIMRITLFGLCKSAQPWVWVEAGVRGAAKASVNTRHKDS